MKWINMSVQKPPRDRNYAMTLLSRDLYFGSDEIRGYSKSLKEGELVEISYGSLDEEPLIYPTKVVQWLDEQDLAGEPLIKSYELI